MKISKITTPHPFLLAAVLLGSTALAGAPARAAENTTQMERQIRDLQDKLSGMQSMQTQLQDLQQQLAALKAADSATKDAVVREAKERQVSDNAMTAAAQAAPAGGVTNRNVKLTFGGFIEMAGIYRNKNQSADVGSSFNGGIPFANSTNAHVSEFRGSARQSRLSILAQGNLDPDTLLTAYYEMDFLGAAPTANSNESSSFNPRIRNVFASIDKTDLGWHLLAGQNWSLATLNRAGIIPRNEVAPAGIEAQYVVGFNWTRNPQVRLVKDFDDKKMWFGVSVEGAQAQVSQGAVPAGTVVNNPGSGQLGNGTPAGNFSLDPGPDVIAKLAADPGFGHYEVFGISRWFRSQVAYTNYTTNGLGVGGSMLLPVVPKMLDFQASALVGKGMGRYGSGQLPDVTTDNTGHLVTLPYVSALIGLVAHPSKELDLYGYAGTEQLEKRYTTVGANAYGYGNPSGINDAGCLVNGGTCNGATAREYELTGGFWYKFYQGSVGMMEFGLQDEYVQRTIFSSNTNGGPTAKINIAMASFRYYPF
ncbi:MAG: hypothetical protein ACYCZX_16705 [Rhodospirillaceae bacterium]